MSESTQAVWFENHFRCQLDSVPNQKVGTGRDHKISRVCIDSSLDVSDVGKLLLLLVAAA